MDINVIWEKAKAYKIQQIEMEFKNIISMIKPNAIGMEIGCYSGGTTIAFSMICSKLITVDINKIFDSTEVEQNCEHTFIIGNSTDSNIIQQVKDKLNGEKLDFIFIDGDHSEIGAYNDFVNYRDLVKSGGLIFFHDIKDSPFHRQHNCYVSNAWNKIKNDYKYEEFIFNDDWAGIGVLHIN